MEIFIPSGISEANAMSRTTHLVIAAHQDDIEIMAYDAVLQCFGNPGAHCTGVVVTDGAGSPRSGIYERYTDDEMRAVRRLEQQKAAIVGEYSAQVFLDYASADVKNPANCEVTEDIKEVIRRTRPDFIYTHNIADKHDTHVGVAVKAIKALRELEYLPKAVYGCEAWRSLDWLNDGDKIRHDVSGRSSLEAALVGVFDSQIAGGKRYDSATAGRRLSNATFGSSHSVDDASAVCISMDLTPLVQNPQLGIKEFIAAHIDNFKKDVLEKVDSMI